jgi:hypothetical protein
MDAAVPEKLYNLDSLAIGWLRRIHQHVIPAGHRCLLRKHTAGYQHRQQCHCQT